MGAFGGDAYAVGWGKVNGGKDLSGIGHDADLRLIHGRLQLIPTAAAATDVASAEREWDGNGGDGSTIGTGGNEGVGGGREKLSIFGR